jgi:error-prone DNA polymerase
MCVKGIAEEVQEKVVNAIGSFALYGFPESHAISFGLIAYASCWLKVHHPAEFYAGLINNQPMGFYNINTLLQDAKRHGVRVRAVSVVASDHLTIVEEEKLKTKNLKTKYPEQTTGTPDSLRDQATIEQRPSIQKLKNQNPDSKPLKNQSAATNNPVPPVNPVQKNKTQSPTALRLGLHRLKGLSERTARRIVAQREESLFLSLADFLQRAQPNKKERRLLAEPGALNDLPDIEHRRHALWMVERPLQLELFQKWEKNIQRPTSNLEPRNEEESSPLKAMTSWERLSSDFATQHQTTGPHPMKLYRRTKDRSASSALKTASQLPTLSHGSYLQIAGMVICRQRPQTAKGHCFISLEDETGIANIFVPRKTFEAHRLTITTEPFLLIEGSVQIGEGGVASVYTHQITALANIPNTIESLSHDFH